MQQHQQRPLGATGEPTGEGAEAPGTGLLEPFLALMPDAALVVDETGRIVSANEQAARLFGYPPGELLDKPVETFIPERLRQDHHGHRRDHATDAQTRTMGAEREMTGRRRDGSEFPIDVSLAPVTGREGRLVVAAVRDVTERRAATTAMAQLAAIVQSSSDAIVSVTLKGEISSWNPGAARMFGYPRSEIVGRHLSVLVPEDASSILEELLEDARAGGLPGARDTQWMRRDGTLLDVALTVSTLRDASDRVLGFSALLRDIAARKKGEAALRAALEQEHRRERQQATAAEIRLALLSDTPDEALDLICRRATELLDSSSAAILVARNEGLRVLASLDRAPPPPGTGAAEEAIATAVVASGRPVRASNPAAVGAAPAGGGAALGAPVVFDGAVRGALTAVREEGAPEFSEDDAEVAAGLADQASLGLELARARADRERLLLVGDRERIARDLHDVVIQRLFAGGMALQGLLAVTAEPRHRERLREVVEELDTTIREIRSTIFELAPPPGAAKAVRAELLEVAREATVALGFAPALRFEGPIDTAVPDDVAPHVLAVLREALTNVARHAGAGRVDVEITADEHVGVVVVDDGRGFRPGGRQSGVANMRRRAEQLGGGLQIQSSPGSGTRLEWWVPLVR